MATHANVQVVLGNAQKHIRLQAVIAQQCFNRLFTFNKLDKSKN